jgi:hypothetical protein
MGQTILKAHHHHASSLFLAQHVVACVFSQQPGTRESALFLTVRKQEKKMEEIDGEERRSRSAMKETHMDHGSQVKTSLILLAHGNLSYSSI